MLLASDNKKTGFTFRGKEIVLQKAPGRPYKPTGLVARGMAKGIFPDKKKMEVVALYAASGRVKEVAALAKVPVDRVYQWRKEQWFQDALREVWQENNEKIDAKFTDIIECALEQVSDRVQHGDWVQNAKGDLLRKPIPAKDLSIVVAINVDKRQLLRGEPTSRTDAPVNVAEKTVQKLEKLAVTFENLAKFGRPKTEVIDVVPESTNYSDESNQTHLSSQKSLNEAQISRETTIDSKADGSGV